MLAARVVLLFALLPLPFGFGKDSMHHVSGTFEVRIQPEPLSQTAGDAGLGRMSLDKTFHGPLEATSKGEMLSASGTERGSAGYVALEKVTGSLEGAAGTFILQHSGTMNRGTPTLTVSVVPDSGTGALKGIAGTMTIDVAGGKHGYTFDYVLMT